METECLEEPFYTKESPGLVRRKTKGIRPILTPRHSERALLTDSTSSSNKSEAERGKLKGIGTKLPQTSGSTCVCEIYQKISFL